MTGYKIRLMKNGNVHECGNVAYVQTDKNHDNDCDYLDNY